MKPAKLRKPGRFQSNFARCQGGVVQAPCFVRFRRPAVLHPFKVKPVSRARVSRESVLHAWEHGHVGKVGYERTKWVDVRFACNSYVLSIAVQRSQDQLDLVKFHRFLSNIARSNPCQIIVDSKMEAISSLAVRSLADACNGLVAV